MPPPSSPERSQQHHHHHSLRRQRRVAWPFLAAAAAASSSSLLLSVEAVAAAASVSSFPPGARRGARRPLPVRPAASPQEREREEDSHAGMRPSSSDAADAENEQQHQQQHQQHQQYQRQHDARREAARAREDEEVYEEQRLQLPPVSLLDEYLPLLLEDIQRVDDELDRELEHMFDDLGASLGFPIPQKMVAPPPPSSSTAPLGGKEMKKRKKQKKAVTAVEEVSSLRKGKASARSGVKEEREEEEEGFISMKTLGRQRQRRSVEAVGGSSSLWQEEEEEEEEEDDEEGEVGLRLKTRKSSSGLKKGKKGGKTRRLALEKKSLAQLTTTMGKKKKSKKTKSSLLTRSSSSSSSYRALRKSKKQQQQQQSSRRALPLTPSRTSGWAMAGASLSGFGWACLAVQEIQNAGLTGHYNYLLNPTQVILSLTVGPALLFLHGGKELLFPSFLPSSSPLSPLTNHRAPFFLRALTWSSLLFAAFGLFTLAQTRPPAVIALVLLVLPLLHGTPHTHNPSHSEEDEDEDEEEEGWKEDPSSPSSRSSSSLISTGVLSALLTVGLPLSLTEAGLLLRSSPPTSSSGPAWIWKLGFLGFAVGLSQMAVTTFRDAQARMEVFGKEEEEEEEGEEGMEGGEVRLRRAGKQVRLLGALSTMALCVGGMGPGAVVGSLIHLLILSRLAMGGRVWGRVGRMMSEMQGGVWAFGVAVVGEAMSMPALEEEEGGEGGRRGGKEEEEKSAYLEVEEDSVATLVAALKKQQQGQQQRQRQQQQAAKLEDKDEQASSPLFSSSPAASSSSSSSRSSSRTAGRGCAEDEEPLGLPLPPSWNDDEDELQ